MNTTAKTGVFLCECGGKIASRVDLPAMEAQLSQDPNVAHLETLPYPCLKPGLERMVHAIAKKGVNRVVVAGCEGRLMLKKLETELEPLGLFKGQIDMVNLRGHVATVSDLPNGLKAEKGAKLVKAAAAEMAALAPSLQTLARIDGPTLILGGGIASFTAAQELVKRGHKCLLAAESTDPAEILHSLHRSYPGERQHHRRVAKIVSEVTASPLVSPVPSGELTDFAGITGDYTATFAKGEGPCAKTLRAGAAIACMDATLAPPAAGFGYDGKTVLFQPELAAAMDNEGAPKGDIVFWINDYEAVSPESAKLSTRSAWAMAKEIADRSPKARITILYNERMAIPLSAAERTASRRINVLWIPYDKAVFPVLRDGYLSFCNLSDHVEHEIPWDIVVLSPQRKIGPKERRIASILGLLHGDGGFLSAHNARVRPDMVGREETYLAGSARYPCDLHETLRQGRRAGAKTAEMLEKAAANELYLPRLVCVVDTEKCVGCGQCQEICDCGGIGVETGPGGGLPRIVDPMVCMGGGTCAAACPYNALTLQNNTTAQREARVAALAGQLRPDEVVAMACAWGGLPAADNAAASGLKYDPRAHILGVPCVGQIDTSVLARAFLEGAPGMILVGCLPEECHHSFGLDHAWSRVSFIKKLFTLCGFDRRRIALAHADLNRPEAFIRTLESFTHTISGLGPIEKTAENVGKLKSVYTMAKENTRVRYLLSAGLRRPWEEAYRGDQRHGLDYDQDFAAALSEEFLQTRVMHLLAAEDRPFHMRELAGLLRENEDTVNERLFEMARDGVIDRRYKNRDVFYIRH